jgi:uncharacterized protein
VNLDDLKRLSVKELRELATGNGVPAVSTLTKEQLLAKLSAVYAARQPLNVVAPTGGVPVPQSQAQGSSGSAANAPYVQKGPDPGLPIPDRYGRDRLVLMVQDPFHVFAYWEVTPDSLHRARAAAGDHYTPVLLLDTGNGTESREVDLAGGNYYLSVAPSGSYVAKLALRDSQGRLHVLAESNRVQTPAPRVSSRVDEAWMSVDETLGELLEMAGLPGQGGGSQARLAAGHQRIAAWTLENVDNKSMFSGLLVSGQFAPLSLSSFSLSSTSLYSGSLSSASLQTKK